MSKGSGSTKSSSSTSLTGMVEARRVSSPTLTPISRDDATLSKISSLFGGISKETAAKETVKGAPNWLIEEAIKSTTNWRVIDIVKWGAGDTTIRIQENGKPDAPEGTFIEAPSNETLLEVIKRINKK